jgi:hypothetical protein
MQGASATYIVINITVLRSWHSNKMPNLSGLCILNYGMEDPEISGNKKRTFTWSMASLRAQILNMTSLSVLAEIYEQLKIKSYPINLRYYVYVWCVVINIHMLCM